MIDIESEQMMTLREVGDWIREKFGHGCAQSTIYHWIGRGARGRKLEVVRVGGKIFTSVEALSRFFVGMDGVNGPVRPCRGRMTVAIGRRAEEAFG